MPNPSTFPLRRTAGRAIAASAAAALLLNGIALLPAVALEPTPPAASIIGNVALASKGGAVTASGSEGNGSYGWTPVKAIDGTTSGPTGQNTSRWSSDASDSAWLAVKSAAPTVIDHVNIYWESACAARYKLQVSTDGTAWIDASGTITPVCGQKDTQKIGGAADPATAYQHVRMQTIERTPIDGIKYGVSLWELEVWDSAEAAPAPVRPLVPQPLLVTEPSAGGTFTPSPALAVVAPGEAAPVAELFAAGLRRSTGFAVPVTGTGAATGNISISVDPAASFTVNGQAAGEESYVLDVTATGVAITAKTPHGAFNAVQTLKQLLPAWISSPTPVNTDWSIEAVHIEDAPRFSYRGVMLDAARSFQTVESVKQYIDALAQLKMSVLHMHLTDDQGWRIEITNDGKAEGDPIDYTKLTSVSGGTAMDRDGYKNEMGRTGFYTQAQFRDIVTYAKERFVTVVPEVDLPGHTNAALHAIPELNTARSLPAKDATGTVPWNGTGKVGYSALDEQHELTYTFVSHVFKQLAELSAGPYVHIGGDESHAMGHTRYVDFINKVMPKVRAATGVGTIGWSEYAEAGLSQGPGYWNGSVVQYWWGSGDLVRDFVAKGGKTVVSAASGSYLDQKYTSSTPIGLTWACSGICDFERYYNWDPTTTVPGGVAEQGVLGVEGPLWSETARGMDQMLFLALPRAASILETGWTAADRKDVGSFAQRLGGWGQNLTIQGSTFHESPGAAWTASSAGVDLKARTGAQAAWPVAKVAAPGTKISADGTQIAADKAVSDGDPASNSALAAPLTAKLVCGSTELPVTFSQAQARDNLHNAGTYTATVNKAFDAGADCLFTPSAGASSPVKITVGAENPLPPAPPGPSGTPTVTIGTAGTPGATITAGAWVPMTLAGFTPNQHVEIRANNTVLFTLRTGIDGRFSGNAVLPASIPAGQLTLTAAEGSRSAEITVHVISANVDERAETTLTTDTGKTVKAGKKVTLQLAASSTSAGKPTGTVEVHAGNAILATAALDRKAEAKATFQANLPPGTHTLTIRYLGDANHAPTQTQVLLTVTAYKPDPRPGL